MRRIIPFLATMFLTVSSVAVAQAQTAEGTASEEEGKGNSTADALLGDIVVTAQKKSVAERAQEVPVALTAFNQETLQVTLAQNLRDVGFFSPNTNLLYNATVPGTASFGIRGLGTNDSTESYDPTVGLVKDGLVYAQRYGSFIETFDLESLEILRGPQGTLFGRNVTGGVVNVRSRRPSLDDGIRGQIRGVVGTHNRFDTMGYVDVTLVPDKLGFIGSAARMSEDGSIRNLNPQLRGTLGDKHVMNYRGALMLQPTSGVELLLTYERNEDRSDSTPAVDPLFSNGFFTANRDLDKQIRLNTNTYIAEANIDVPGGLLTVIAGKRDTRYGNNGIAELDGSPQPAIGIRQDLRDKQKSVEARYATRDLFDNIDFTVGLFYMDHDFSVINGRYIGTPLSATPIIQGSGARQDAKSWAAFGQGEIRFTDTLSLTAGGRYSHEKKVFDIAVRATGGCGLAPFFGTDTLTTVDKCNFVGPVSASWSDFSPMARLTWKPNDDFLIFASAAKGFRSGGFNSRAQASGLVNGKPIPFNPESLISYEIGIKSDWFDRRLRFNASAFYNKLDDLQVEVTGPPPANVQTTFNAGKANISGVEVELTGVVFQDAVSAGDSFIVQGNYGYVNADYTFFDRNGDGISDGDQFEFSKVPPHTYSVSAIYDTPLGDAGKLSFRGAYHYEDTTFPDSENARPRLPKIKQLDASISFTSADDSVTIRAFGKNLTNHKELFQILPVIPGRFGIYPRPSRRFGVEAILNF